MTEINAVLEYLRDNPKAMNKEIADNLKIDYDNVKSYINRLKTGGYIEVQGQGITRTVTVLKEMPVREKPTSKNSYKKEIIETMIDKYMEDFKDSGTLNDRIEVGKVILRLLEKL